MTRQKLQRLAMLQGALFVAVITIGGTVAGYITGG